MFLRRIIENLKTQNWTAVTLDLGIVIIGVFIGTQVSNWNQQRIQKRETARLLLELRPALKDFADFFDSAIPNYAKTRAYSETAFAGWRRDPAVSDEQFVISAYQASRIFVLGINADNWATIFGGDRLREIDNADLRRGLANLMTFNYDQIDIPAIATPYRQHVRSVIPEDIQDAIRAQCDAKSIPGKPQASVLPATCDLDLPENRFASGAAALRAHPELADELRWHLAAVTNFLDNLTIMNKQTGDLLRALDQSAKAS